MGKKSKQAQKKAKNNWNDQNNGNGKSNNLGKERKSRKAKKKGQNVGDSSYLDIEKKVNKVNKTLLDVEGDGNCMFRSLSHQLYGVQDKHTVLRQQVCDYLVDNKEHFVMFFATDDDEETFEQHIKRMRNLGTYGDQIELVAFANLFKVDLHIYQNDLDSVMTIRGQTIGETKAEEDNEKDLNEEKAEKPTLHLAYHTWEHYSSVVDLDSKSLPQMVYEEDSEGDDPSYKFPKTSTQKAKKDVIIQRQIDRIVIKTKFEDEEVIEKLLKENNSNLTKVIKLIKKHYSDLKKEAQQEVNSEQPSDIIDDATETLADKNQLQVSNLSTEQEADIDNNYLPEHEVYSEATEQGSSNDGMDSPPIENEACFEGDGMFSLANRGVNHSDQVENPAHEVDQIQENRLSTTELKKEAEVATQQYLHLSNDPTDMEYIPNQSDDLNISNLDIVGDAVNSTLTTCTQKTNPLKVLKNTQKGKRTFRKDKKLAKKLQKNTKFNNNKGEGEGQNVQDTPTKSLSKEISYIQL